MHCPFSGTKQPVAGQQNAGCYEHLAKKTHISVIKYDTEVTTITAQKQAVQSSIDFHAQMILTGSIAYITP